MGKDGDTYFLDKLMTVGITKVKDNPHPIYYMIFDSNLSEDQILEELSTERPKEKTIEGISVTALESPKDKMSSLIYEIPESMYQRLKIITQLKDKNIEIKKEEKPFKRKDKEGKLKIVKCSKCKTEIIGDFFIPNNRNDFIVYCKNCCKKLGIHLRGE